MEDITLLLQSVRVTATAKGPLTWHGVAFPGDAMAVIRYNRQAVCSGRCNPKANGWISNFRATPTNHNEDELDTARAVAGT